MRSRCILATFCIPNSKWKIQCSIYLLYSHIIFNQSVNFRTSFSENPLWEISHVAHEIYLQCSLYARLGKSILAQFMNKNPASPLCRGQPWTMNRTPYEEVDSCCASRNLPFLITKSHAAPPSTSTTHVCYLEPYNTVKSTSFHILRNAFGVKWNRYSTKQVETVQHKHISSRGECMALAL